MPWREWGETDRVLSLVLDTHENLLCPCGCGQWMPYAHDPDTDGAWEVDEGVVCYAGAALERWRKDNDQPEPGLMPLVKWIPEGEG